VKLKPSEKKKPLDTQSTRLSTAFIHSFVHSLNRSLYYTTLVSMLLSALLNTDNIIYDSICCCREFLIFAPKIVRPDMVYEVHVTLNRKFYSNMVVTGLLSSDGNEYASGRVQFQHVGTKVIQLKVYSHLSFIMLL